MMVLPLLMLAAKAMSVPLEFVVFSVRMFLTVVLVKSVPVLFALIASSKVSVMFVPDGQEKQPVDLRCWRSSDAVVVRFVGGVRADVSL